MSGTSSVLVDVAKVNKKQNKNALTYNYTLFLQLLLKLLFSKCCFLLTAFAFKFTLAYSFVAAAIFDANYSKLYCSCSPWF